MDELKKIIILVIYDINFVFVYFDYIIVMKDGVVIYCGVFEEIM